MLIAKKSRTPPDDVLNTSLRRTAIYVGFNVTEVLPARMGRQEAAFSVFLALVANLKEVLGVTNPRDDINLL